MAHEIMQSEIHDFIAQLFPVNGGKVASKVAKANAKMRIERFHSCYNADDITNFRGTKWGLILAISDYTSHVPLHDNKQR